MSVQYSAKWPNLFSNISGKIAITTKLEYSNFKNFWNYMIQSKPLEKPINICRNTFIYLIWYEQEILRYCYKTRILENYKKPLVLFIFEGMEKEWKQSRLKNDWNALTSTDYYNLLKKPQTCGKFLSDVTFPCRLFIAFSLCWTI